MDTLTLTQPDDWHVHLRDSRILNVVGPYTANIFARAIVMPNLSPPIINAELSEGYQKRIQQSLSKSFTPLMTLYLTDATPVELIAQVKPKANDYHAVYGVKLYPQAATTNAEHGVKNPLALLPIFEAMAERNLPLLVHGEMIADNIDIYDREKIFIDKVLYPLREKIPSLKIVFEHITTAEAVAFVLESPHTAATITPHHLYYNRSALFAGGLRPHRYCLPLAKRESDRNALIKAACSGDSHFFLGTDSAPHPVDEKESACGCAGIFNAVCALETYAEIFAQEGALNQLERFASHNGATFYGLPINKKTITLKQQAWQVPHAIPIDDKSAHDIIPFRAGEQIAWQVDRH